jgi:hypothetical protein
VILATQIVYDDVLNSQWQDASVSSTRNFNNLSPVKVGSKSIKVDYSSNGSLVFNRNTPLNTSANTKVKFWVYNNDRYGIKVFTESAENGKSSEVIVKPVRGKWTEVIITMSQLGNPSTIKKLFIQNNASAQSTLYFDQVQLTDVSENIMAARSKSDASINVATGSLQVHVYPNPAQGFINIIVHAETAATGALQLIDKWGRVALQQFITLNKGNNQDRVSITHLAPGTYFLHLAAGEEKRMVKIVVQ